MNIPRVTVGIPTFNRAHFLRDAVEGVLAQTFTDFELVISDNASSDGTVEMVSRYRDPRIRIHRNASNIGLVRNFNRCLDLARGEFVVILGSDDYWDKELLARQVALMDQNPRVLQVQTAGTFVAADKTPLRTYALSLGPVTPGGEYFRRLMLDLQLEGFLSSTLFRTAAVRAAGGFDNELPNFHDVALIGRLTLEGDLGYLPAPLVFARKHAGNFHQNWSQAEYLRERLRFVSEILGTWPQMRQPAIAGVAGQAKDTLAMAVLDSLVAIRLAGGTRRDIAGLFWRANALRSSRLSSRCLLKAGSALLCAPAILPRVVARFGKTSRQLRAHHSGAQ